MSLHPPAITHSTNDTRWFSSNNASIAPGALITLLVESVLDSLFTAPAQQGVYSPWMQGGNQKQTKQSGQTHVVRNDFNGFGSELEHSFPRQLDAVINAGLVITLPAYGTEDLSGSGTTGTTANSGLYTPGQRTVANGTVASGTVVGGTSGRNNDANFLDTLVMAAGNASTAYVQFAQYAVIEQVQVHLNQTLLMNFSGEDLLILHDVYGVGKHGIDVVSNSLFNTNFYPTRASQSIAPTTHVISLGLWFEAGSSHAMLLSAHAYSPLSISVRFADALSIVQASAAQPRMGALDANSLRAAFIYDSYYMTAAEKEIISNTTATVPYRKLVKTVISGGNATGTNNLNFNFVGADVIAYAKQNNNKAVGKTGQFGVNDSQRPFLNSFQLTVNHNQCHEVNHATTRWAHITGNTHIPSLNALYYTPAPGFDLQNVKGNKPFATIPWSRLENAAVTCTTDLPTGGVAEATLRFTCCPMCSVRWPVATV